METCGEAGARVLVLEVLAETAGLDVSGSVVSEAATAGVMQAQARAVVASI